MFTGQLVRCAADFVFTSESVLAGPPGVSTLSVYDEEDTFIKDTRRITLKSGESAARVTLKAGESRASLEGW